MSWNIVSVAVYSRKFGSSRKIEFRESGLSIISGTSQTGKSTVVDIIDYCLGSSNCGIAYGPIRSAVQAVGMEVRRGSERLAIVRPLPKDDRTTSVEAWFDASPSASLPDLLPSEWTANLDTVKTALSSMAGIDSTPVLTNLQRGAADARTPANIRHCAPFLMQPQDVIASRIVTFPGLENPFYKLHTIDALWYFLGIFSMKTLAKRRELRELQQQANRDMRAQREIDGFRVDGYERGLDLWRASKVLGVVDGAEPKTVDLLLYSLERVRSNLPRTFGASDEARALAEADAEVATFQLSLANTRLALAELAERAQVQEVGTSVAASQHSRVALRDLLPRASMDGVCPLCQTGAISVDRIESELNTAAQALERMRVVPERIKSRIAERQSRLLEQQTIDRRKLDRATKAREEALRSLSLALSGDDRREQAIRLGGRIEEYLSGMRVATADTETVGASRDERIRELLATVGSDVLQTALSAAQSDISAEMTRLAERLDVEFPKQDVRLNLEHLTIEVRFGKSNWVPLSQLGSGANWLSYHIVACCALHSYLATRGRPVPRFFVLDQPSQVWFPVTQMADGERVVPRNDKALQAVARIYDLLAEVGRQIPGLQILVLDHASLDTPLFRSHMLANEQWFEGKGLVPANWFE